jgi:hypothetical protein
MVVETGWHAFSYLFFEVAEFALSTKAALGASFCFALKSFEDMLYDKKHRFREKPCSLNSEGR